MSFDPRCHDLAELFLSDRAIVRSAQRKDLNNELAQRIQDVIENFIEEMDNQGAFLNVRR